jgi:hypothetical protein
MLLLPLGLLACSAHSEVAELEPGTYGLTVQATSLATAARSGVERARDWCAARGRGFEPVRTEIGRSDYRIAFRCPARLPEAFPGAQPFDPASLAPPVEEIPGFRREPGLL